ncbi:MAG: type III pantothenate kinase [Saprospiraceae bacterium]|nr:type III pantothenate kinase [Saprospiraceae bacterium]
MNLVIDIGNTRVKTAIFNDDGLVNTYISDSLSVEDISNLSLKYSIKSVIISSTSVTDDALLDRLKIFENFINLDSQTKLPILNRYQTPETLGKDRLAAAVGTWSRYPKVNSLVIDMGTCITIDILTFDGAFEGGNISPGVHMRIKAMHQFTAKLPMVDTVLPEALFGSSTDTALRNGVLRGTFFELDGYIRVCKHKYGKINVILTGGDAPLFAKFSKNKIFVLPNLVLEGLNEILNYNVH